MCPTNPTASRKPSKTASSLPPSKSSNTTASSNPVKQELTKLFHSYIPWQAIACILSEIIARPQSELVNRAWRAIDTAFKDWDDMVKHGKSSGMLWTPMRKLIARARKKREEDMLAAETFAGLDIQSNRGITGTHDPGSNPAEFHTVSAQAQPLESKNVTVTQAFEVFR
jgi:hypothetical protein